jgi:hypothetical protein
MDEDKEVRCEQCREAAASDLSNGSRTGWRDGCRLAQIAHSRCLGDSKAGREHHRHISKDHMLPITGIPETIARGMAGFRDLFCRTEGCEHVSRYVTGLILSPNNTLQGI